MEKMVRGGLGGLAASVQADEGLLLALINSTPTIEGSRRDELAEDGRARAWLAEHIADATADETDLALLRATRADLQRVIRGEAGPEILTGALAEVRMRPTAGRDGVAWVRDVPAGAAVAARAALAWSELEAALPGRLRACENSECTLFFVDRSRPNNGRWCSMAVCGNRMKARRHYARSKAEQPEPAYQDTSLRRDARGGAEA